MFDLLLMRHAKSDWFNNGSTSLSDRDRPLSDRGIHDAKLMGKHLAKLELIPDSILVSSAERTQQTVRLLLEGVRDSVSFEPEQLIQQMIVSNELYLAGPDTLLRFIENYAQDNKRLLLVTHNPGMDDIVSYLSDTQLPFTASGKLMTTCAVAAFQFESLDDLQRSGSANLISLLRPKEISS